MLYPPESLDNRVFDKASIRDLCYHTDDLWLNAMSRLKGTEIVCLGEFPILFCISGSQKESLGAINCSEERNDVELRKILEKYPTAY